MLTILLVFTLSIAKAQDKSFVLAPLVGLDQLSPKRTPIASTGIAQNVAVVYKMGVLYGLEGSQWYWDSFRSAKAYQTIRAGRFSASERKIYVESTIYSTATRGVSLFQQNAESVHNDG